MNQSIHPFNQSINPSINQSINQSISQSVSWSVNPQSKIGHSAKSVGLLSSSCNTRALAYAHLLSHLVPPFSTYLFWPCHFQGALGSQGPPGVPGYTGMEVSTYSSWSNIHIVEDRLQVNDLLKYFQHVTNTGSQPCTNADRVFLAQTAN